MLRLLMPNSVRKPFYAMIRLAPCLPALLLAATADAAPEMPGNDRVQAQTLKLVHRPRSDTGFAERLRDGLRQDSAAAVRLLPGGDPAPALILAQGEVPKVHGTSWRNMRIAAAANGHFYVKARVKRTPPSFSMVSIDFLVDSGSSFVALNFRDAERLGIDIDSLEFNYISQTANGAVRYALITLPELRIGSLKVEDVEASVVDADLDISLLGNSFLGRLKSYAVKDGELILRW